MHTTFWETEDTVQDVFVKAYHCIKSYKNSFTFGAWLYKMAYNQAVNQLRRKKLLKMIPLLDTNINCIPEDSIEEDFYKDELSCQMEQALERLSPEEKNLIVLRILEERSYEEISQITGIRPDTLRKKYERARNKIKTHYENTMRGLENETQFHRIRC